MLNASTAKRQGTSFFAPDSETYIVMVLRLVFVLLYKFVKR